MKKIGLFLVVFVLALTVLFTQSANANTFREVKVVNGSSLVVKASATASSATTATLKKGDFVTVFSTTNGWAYMQSGTKKGYVNASFLATPKSSIKIASSKSGLVVKESPSKSAKTLATLQYNMIVEDFGSVGAGWSFVQYGNVTGYVVSSFVGTPKTVTKTTKEQIAIRNIASSSGTVKANLVAGTKVTVHSTIAGWSYVSSGSVRGYTQAAKLLDVKTNTIAYAKNYLPACPKTFVYKDVNTEDGYTETEYTTYKCEFEGSGRLLIEPTDDFGVTSSYYTLQGSDMYVGHYEGHTLYKFPLQVGKSWSYDSYVDSYETKYVMSLNEVVTTPAGTFFNVIKIRTTTQYGVSYTYLAPNVGIVKSEHNYNFYGEKYAGYSELYSLY